MMAKEKRKQHPKGHIVIAILGGILGYSAGLFVNWQAAEGISADERMLRLFAAVIMLVAAFIIHTVLHEGGHLVFGLMSGYRFSSFRIGSHMLMKAENGKLVHKKIRIAGTGGQCLMSPPDLVDGRIPVVLYNLGGSIVNLVVSALLLPLFFLMDGKSMLAMFVFILMGTGILVGLCNGIPMKTKAVSNDGFNAISLGKNPEALRAFWIQLKANELLTRGVRIKDMPEEWFAVPSDESMKNGLIAAIGVHAASRLMDQHRFDEAEHLINHLLEIESGIAGLHRNLLVCDLIYLELIGQNRPGRVRTLYSGEVKKFVRAMKRFPSVIRLNYAHHLLAENKPRAAARAMAAFEKIAATYPYPSDIDTERELIRIAAEKGIPLTD